MVRFCESRERTRILVVPAFFVFVMVAAAANPSRSPSKPNTIVPSDKSTPSVIKTLPPAYADNVNPAAKFVAVTFDQKMTDQSWSWTGSGDTFPEIIGHPRYMPDKKTCRINVKLQPGKVYWVGINSPSDWNFKSESGIPAKQYVILFATRDEQGKPALIPEDLLNKARQINSAALPEKERTPKQAVTVAEPKEGSRPVFVWPPKRNQPPAAITVGGKPFFVICARSAVPEEFEEYKNAGFNTVYTHLPSNPALDEAQKYGLLAIHNFADYKCKDGLFLPEFWQEVEEQTTRWNNHPALLGWMQSTGMLYNKMNPSDIQRLYNLLYAKNPKKLRLLLYGFGENNWKQLYPYNDYTDVIVLENMSIMENNRIAALVLEHTLELAKGRPIWFIVHANSILWEKLSFPLAKLRSSTYLEINHGATGILIDGFQNRLWKQWGRDVPGLADPRLADLRKEAIHLAGELKTLSPAILAGSLKDANGLSGNNQIDFQAFANPENTTLYFIAVSTSGQTVASSFYVPQGMKNAIEVMNEHRSLTPKDGSFVDSFEPLETHVYVIRRE